MPRLELVSIAGDVDIPEVVAVTAIAGVDAVAEELDDDGDVITEAVPAVRAVEGVKGVAAHVERRTHLRINYDVLDGNGKIAEVRGGELTDVPPALLKKANVVIGELLDLAQAGIS